MKRKLLVISLLSLIWLAIFTTEGLCVASNLRIKVDGSDPWVNINVSESYEQCELLNRGNSTLGTTALKAHLTTDEDWSAMAIFAVGPYGKQTTNTPSSTTGNGSGIMDMNKEIYWQTTGVQGNTTSYVKGLYEENGQPKKYVTQWSTSRADTNFVGFTTTAGWYGSCNLWSNGTVFPVMIRSGLFGVSVGRKSDATGSGYNDCHSNGGAFALTSFRPAIWN